MLFMLFLSIGAKVFSMDRELTIELRNAVLTAGKIYVAVYNSESTYKKDEPVKSYIIDPTSMTLKISVIIPEGFYVVSAFQDFNGNKELDLGFLGIPKEPIWLSNYDGKGIPGGFEKLKFELSERNQTIIINKVKF